MSFACPATRKGPYGSETVGRRVLPSAGRGEEHAAMQCNMQGTVVAPTPRAKRSVQETQVMWQWLQQMSKMLSASRTP